MGCPCIYHLSLVTAARHRHGISLRLVDIVVLPIRRHRYSRFDWVTRATCRFRTSTFQVNPQTTARERSRLCSSRPAVSMKRHSIYMSICRVPQAETPNSPPDHQARKRTHARALDFTPRTFTAARSNSWSTTPAFTTNNSITRRHNTVHTTPSN